MTVIEKLVNKYNLNREHLLKEIEEEEKFIKYIFGHIGDEISIISKKAAKDMTTITSDLKGLCNELEEIEKILKNEEFKGDIEFLRIKIYNFSEKCKISAGKGHFKNKQHQFEYMFKIIMGNLREAMKRCLDRKLAKLSETEARIKEAM